MRQIVVFADDSPRKVGPKKPRTAQRTLIKAGRIRLDAHYFFRFVIQRLGLTVQFIVATLRLRPSQLPFQFLAHFANEYIYP